MSELAARWTRVGDAVHTRFRALGVQDPAQATADWLREAWWLDGPGSLGPDGLGRLHVEATRFGLERASSQVQADALAPFCCNLAQLGRVRASSESGRLVRALAVLDGLSTDEIARLVEQPEAAVQQALEPIEEAVIELADPLPEGSPDQGHLSTLQLHAYALGAVADPPAHLQECSWCLGRFTAWQEGRAAFEALPVPQPPAAPPRAGANPLRLALPVGLCLGAFAAGLALTWPTDPPPTPAGSGPAVQVDGPRVQPPQVELWVDGAPAAGGIPVGSLVTLQVDPAGARHLAVLRGADQVLFQAPVVGQGPRALPVDLIAGQAVEVVHVIASAHPLPADQLAVEHLRERADVAVASVVLRP